MYRAIKIIKLSLQLQKARLNLKHVDSYINTVRGILGALKLFGLNIIYFGNILDQIEYGKERFNELTKDAEERIIEVKFYTEVCIEVQRTSKSSIQVIHPYAQT